MDKRTNYGKIFAITLAIVGGVCTIAFVLYKLFVEKLTKLYAEDNGEEFLEEADSNDCECIADEPEKVEEE